MWYDEFNKNVRIVHAEGEFDVADMTHICTIDLEMLLNVDKISEVHYQNVKHS